MFFGCISSLIVDFYRDFFFLLFSSVPYVAFLSLEFSSLIA